jgi:hypothetical protein
MGEVGGWREWQTGEVGALIDGLTGWVGGWVGVRGDKGGVGGWVGIP